MRQKLRLSPIAILLLALLAAGFTPASAQQPVSQKPDGLLTLDTVFSYQPKSIGPIRWQHDGKAYLALEPSSTTKDAQDIVRYDAAGGEKSVLVPAERLIPRGASAPLAIDQFDFSEDEQKLLIFTNSQRVWRSNTRGDYWVLDLKSWDLRRLGGNAKPSTL